MERSVDMSVRAAVDLVYPARLSCSDPLESQLSGFLERNIFDHEIFSRCIKDGSK